MARERNRLKAMLALARKAGATCGAKGKRTGQPCKLKPVSLFTGNGRCRLHGGLSTGAKTAQGLARIREGYRAWQERKQAQNPRADRQPPLEMPSGLV